MQNLNKEELSKLMGVSVLVHNKDGKPAVELRSMTLDPDLIKLLISCAYYGRPIIIMPKFTDTIQSLNSCIEKGILVKQENQYFFTI